MFGLRLLHCQQTFLFKFCNLLLTQSSLREQKLNFLFGEFLASLRVNHEICFVVLVRGFLPFFLLHGLKREFLSLPLLYEVLLFLNFNLFFLEDISLHLLDLENLVVLHDIFHAEQLDRVFAHRTLLPKLGLFKHVV